MIFFYSFLYIYSIRLSLYNSHISLPKTGYRNSLKYTIRSLINDKKINVQELESMKQNTLQFYNSRHLLNQLGYLSWKHRPTVELLQISPALIRELKHLDHLGSLVHFKFLKNFFYSDDKGCNRLSVPP